LSVCPAGAYRACPQDKEQDGAGLHYTSGHRSRRDRRGFRHPLRHPHRGGSPANTSAANSSNR